LEAFLNELGNIPKVAIVGNWEYWSDIDFKKLADVYARHQGRLLVNDCQFAKVGKLHLALVGLDDALAGVPDILHALKQCPQADARILIEHTPEFFGKPLDSVAGNAPYLLSLSGHTHGGQIALFGFSLQIPPGSGAYNRGWYDTKLGRMYVSRGIGTSVIPIRIGAAPELPLFIVNLQQ
jgi:predicted MPP superfamily phosphohydrolase